MTVGRRRWETLAALVLVIALGLLYDRFRATAPGLNQELGGVLYVLAWSLGVFLLAPLAPTARWAPWIVGATTAGLEFLQLWQPPGLQALRATRLGALVLGTTFAWADFPYYLAGASLAWLVLRGLARPS